MANYIYIQNYSKNGKLAISRKVIESYCNQTLDNFKNVKLLKPIDVVCHHSGKVEIILTISIKEIKDANTVCERIQKEITEIINAYTESIPFSINIDVKQISKK